MSLAKDCQKKLLKEKLQTSERKFLETFSNSVSAYSLVLLVLVLTFSGCFTSCRSEGRDYCSLWKERKWNWNFLIVEWTQNLLFLRWKSVIWKVENLLFGKCKRHMCRKLMATSWKDESVSSPLAWKTAHR